MSEPNYPSISADQLQRLFGEVGSHFDLNEGIVTDPFNTRIIYLSTDIVRGIYEALSYEAGAAWKLILQNSGYLWGKSIFNSLEKGLPVIAKQELRKLTVADYLTVLENYFAMHGWGKLAVDLSAAPQHGIVRIQMQHSLFAEALPHVNETVDALIAGMLRGFFEKISGRELDCVETACIRLGAPACEFLISAPSRIQAIMPDVERGASTEAVLQALRATVEK